MQDHSWDRSDLLLCSALQYLVGLLLKAALSSAIEILARLDLDPFRV